MQSTSEQSGRAMGLVKAVHGALFLEKLQGLRYGLPRSCIRNTKRGWPNLRPMGFKRSNTHSGSLVFARALEEVGEYAADCLLYPRNTVSTLAFTPVPLSSLTRVYTCDPLLQRGGCCATKKLSSRASEYILCGSTCDEGSNFCTVHSMFMTTNRTRMILPEECAGYRFDVGHAEFGLMFFKPLSDSHFAQHFAMLRIVPTEVGLLYDQGYVAEQWVPPDHQGPARSRGASKYGGGSTIWDWRVYPCQG
jgi:hypothetical protein